MAGQSPDPIEVLEEILGSLRITEDNMSNQSTEPAILETEEMSTVLVSAMHNENVTMKNMVPDPGWFNRDRTKFEDQWRGIRLFLKSNRVVAADDKITIVLAQLRESIAGIYAQKKINKLDDIEDTQNWKEFVKEIKIAFSNKRKIANVEWRIETFQQGKNHIANFMIEFEVLDMKAETDDIHVIFLLKKNIQVDIIKTILEYPLMAVPDTLKE